MPERPLSAVFAVNHTSENSVKDIFQDLQNIGIPAHGVSCLQRVSDDRFCITFGKENHRTTFLKKSSFVPHFADGRCQLSTSSNLVYVAAYDTPFEISDQAIRNHFSRFGVVRSSRRCKLPTMSVIFNKIRMFGMEISKPVPSFLRFGRYLVRLKHKDQTPTCRKCNRPGHQARVCPNIFCFHCEELEHMTDSCPKLKKFTATFALLLATWQLIVGSHGISVSLFYDPTTLTRPCDNPPSCLQRLLNLLSNPPTLLM